MADESIGTRWRPRHDTLMPPKLFTAFEATFNDHLMLAYQSHTTGQAYWLPADETGTFDTHLRMEASLNAALEAAEQWAKEH